MLLRPEPRSLQTTLGAIDSERRTVYPSGLIAAANPAPRWSNPIGSNQVEIPRTASPDIALAGIQPIELPSLDDDAFNKVAGQSEVPQARLDTVEDVHAAPIEVWEGEVRSIDERKNVMQVRLTPKLSKAEQHTGEIDLEWVAEQDRDLLKPGAVFYWTLYKETRRGTVINAQSLRFRRLPNWSRRQIQRVREESKDLFKNARDAKELT
jgi:hypothetical protein